MYACDANGKLASVTYPDLTPANTADNPKRLYVYNEAAYTANTNLPSALTGIVDENGQHFATFGYNAAGLAISSKHAGGAERVSVSYGTPPVLRSSTYLDPATGVWYDTTYYDPPTGTTVTDALGTARAYGFSSVQNVIKNTGANQPCSMGCGNAAAATSYDSNGNVASRTDFNGNKTTYAYDLTRNLETQRVEGLTNAGATTPETRTTTTEWHPTWRLIKRMAEPKRITSFVYHGDAGVTCGATGALCTKTLTETTDANGSQGFSATTTTNVRTWTYTYNSLGQVLTVNGPRTDVTDVTTYTYYTTNDVAGNFRIGDLATVSNALGHVTNISAYDASGRPKTMTDPSGLVTQLTYWPRGWLKTRSVGGLLTSFDYDAVGQLTKVTLPNASFIAYTYDAAHRLTDITDALGNRVHYTLDLMGNRTKEEVFDPSNVIVQSRGRVFDALSRLQQELNAANQVVAAYTYDNNGNLKTGTRKVDGNVANDQLSTYDYDPLNRVKQVTDALLELTRYTYDGLDQLTGVTDPRNLLTGYTVDGLGNSKQSIRSS